MSYKCIYCMSTSIVAKDYNKCLYTYCVSCDREFLTEEQRKINKERDKECKNIYSSAE